MRTSVSGDALEVLRRRIDLPLVLHGQTLLVVSLGRYVEDDGGGRPPSMLDLAVCGPGVVSSGIPSPHARPCRCQHDGAR
jgi:hypothetical protein